MGKRQRDWAKRERALLVRQLGGKCAYCGATDHIQLHVISGGMPEHHGLDTSRRVSFYRKQFRIGNLQAACSRCHSTLHTTIREKELKLSLLRAVNGVNNSNPPLGDSNLGTNEKVNNV